MEQVKKGLGVDAVVYSTKEFELTVEALKEVFGLSDEDIREAQKDWHKVGDIAIKIKFNTRKKTKDEPFAQILVRPADQPEPEIKQIDLHYGLFILGTEKHESRRIDNQLRGRS